MKSGDQETLRNAADVLSGESKKSGLKRILPFLGPAFIAGVAYMDPGNFATNIQAGAQFGYLLLWVIVASNLTAMLIQTLSAKLGIATGLNLAEQCREHFPRRLTLFMWVLMELVAMATDLAEFLGAALGFNLLFGIPLWLAGILAAITTFLILSLERYGFRPLEAVITSMVGVIAVCYVVETILDQPAWGLVVYHSVVPMFRGRESVLLATGILGATVMPHAIFLHSALTQGRIVVREPVMLRRLFRYEIGGGYILQYRDDLRRIDRRGPPNIGALAGAGGELGVCYFTAGFRLVLLVGGDHGRAGDHAGILEPPYPALGAAPGDDGTAADRYHARSGSHPDAGDQPGVAQLRVALCDHPSGAVYQQ
jgi:hypothetical protein